MGRGRAWVAVESYRTEREKANLLAWHLTCECFFTPAEWEWVFRRFGSTGDHAFRVTGWTPRGFGGYDPGTKVLRRGHRIRELASFAGHAARFAVDPRRIRNLARVEASARLGLEGCLGLPLHVFVEVSGDCNDRCVKCGRGHPRFRDDGPVAGAERGGPDGSRLLSFDRIRLLLDEIGDTLLTMRLWHYGEPLLNPDLPRMVRAAKDHGVFVAASTNGSLLVPAVARDLVDAGLDYLIVSFDAGTRETYRLLHGADAFEAVRSNLVGLSATRRDAGSRRPFVEFQVVVHRQNEAEIGLALGIARDVGADKVSLVRLDERDVDPGTSAVLGGVEPLDRRFGPLPHDDAEPCRLAWREAVIRHSGAVLPCVSDLGQDHALGRLFRDPTRAGFREVWNGPDYRDFRRRARSKRRHHRDVRRVHAADGRRILDFSGGMNVLNHGHNHPRVLAARRRFNDERRLEVCKAVISPYEALLAHNVAALVGGDLRYSSFCTSGAEANEGALKRAMPYGAPRATRSCPRTSGTTGRLSGPCRSRARSRSPTRSCSSGSTVASRCPTGTSRPCGRWSPGARGSAGATSRP